MMAICHSRHQALDGHAGQLPCVILPDQTSLNTIQHLLKIINPKSEQEISTHFRSIDETLAPTCDFHLYELTYWAIDHGFQSSGGAQEAELPRLKGKSAFSLASKAAQSLSVNDVFGLPPRARDPAMSERFLKKVDTVINTWTVPLHVRETLSALW